MLSCLLSTVVFQTEVKKKMHKEKDSVGIIILGGSYPSISVGDGSY